MEQSLLVRQGLPDAERGYSLLGWLHRRIEYDPTRDRERNMSRDFACDRIHKFDAGQCGTPWFVWSNCRNSFVLLDVPRPECEMRRQAAPSIWVKWIENCRLCKIGRTRLPRNRVPDLTSMESWLSCLFVTSWKALGSRSTSRPICYGHGPHIPTSAHGKLCSFE